MDKSPLSALYDDLKTKTETSDRSPMMVGTPLVQVPTVGSMPGTAAPNNTTAWRNAAVKEAEKMKETFCRTLLVKVYCDVCPLDNDWKGGNQETMAGDVNRFLADKNMSATQYLTSAHEKTKAPMLEMVLRAAESLRNKFMKEADETLKDAKANDLDIPPPQIDEENEQETEQMLVDVEKDASYDTFIDELKRKTKDRIVQDITDEIEKGKEKKDMTFDLKPDGLGDPATADPNALPADPGALPDLGAPPAMEKAEVSVQDNEGADPDAPGKPAYTKRVPEHKKSFKTDQKSAGAMMDRNPGPKKITPKTESTFLFNMDYITRQFIKENVEVPEYPAEDNPIMALAIRESILNTLDVIFKQPNSEYRPYTSKLNFGKGVLIQENVVATILCESGEVPLSTGDRTKFKARFPDAQCTCVKTSSGKFRVKTHRSSSDEYDSIDAMPYDAVRAVSSSS